MLRKTENVMLLVAMDSIKKHTDGKLFYKMLIITGISKTKETILKKKPHHTYICIKVQSAPGDNTGAVIEVTSIREGGEWPHRVVTGKLRQTLHEIIQLIQVPAFI